MDEGLSGLLSAACKPITYGEASVRAYCRCLCAPVRPEITTLRVVCRAGKMQDARIIDYGVGTRKNIADRFARLRQDDCDYEHRR